MATLCNGIGLGLFCLQLSITVEGYSAAAANSVAHRLIIIDCEYNTHQVN